MECGVQLVEAGVNGSKPADTTAAAADLLTEMAALEQVCDPTPTLHFWITHSVYGVSSCC